MPPPLWQTRLLPRGMAQRRMTPRPRQKRRQLGVVVARAELEGLLGQLRPQLAPVAEQGHERALVRGADLDAEAVVEEDASRGQHEGRLICVTES